jgi:hypothetical protein
MMVAEGGRSGVPERGGFPHPIDRWCPTDQVI